MILALLITDVAFGLVSKVVPQLNVFSVAFPLKVGVALLVFSASLPFLGGWMSDQMYTSVATALHALASLKVELGSRKEPCLDFIDTLWNNRGGFCGNWEDGQLDCEYTYYALLAQRSRLVYHVTPFAKAAHPVPFGFDWSTDYYPRQYRLAGPELSVYRLTGGRCG